MGRTQQMDMISITPNPLKLDVVALAYPHRRLPNHRHDVLIQQRAPILHPKYDVVMNLPCAMARLVYNLVRQLNILRLLSQHPKPFPAACRGESQVELGREIFFPLQLLLPLGNCRFFCNRHFFVERYG